METLAVALAYSPSTKAATRNEQGEEIIVQERSTTFMHLLFDVILWSSAGLVNPLACLSFSDWIKAYESVTTEDSGMMAIIPPQSSRSLRKAKPRNENDPLSRAKRL